MTVLLLGSAGQIGSSLTVFAPQGIKAVGLAHDQLDLTDEGALVAALEAYQPAAVINAAAFTAVDRAETETETAFAVNARAPALIARWCRRQSVPFVHFGTDYVFDGRKVTPYSEDDPAAPINVYGRSKAEGEAAVLSEGGTVLRVSWVHGSTAKGFVPWIVRGLLSGETLRVAADQTGSPTAADEAARIAWNVLSAVTADASLAGLYHAVSAGVTTRFAVACFIRDVLKEEGYTPAGVIDAVSTDELGLSAARPLNCALNTDRLQEVFGITPECWQTGVRRTVRRILA